MGVSLVFPLFDGFANKYAVQKKQLELVKLQWQKEDTLQTLNNTIQQLKRRTDNAQQLVTSQDTTLLALNDKAQLIQRLSDQALIEKTRLLKQQLQTQTEQLNQQLTQLDGILATYKLHILAQPY